MGKIAVLLEGVGFSVKLWSDPDAFILGKSIFANLDEMSNKVDAAMFIRRSRYGLIPWSSAPAESTGIVYDEG